MAHSVIRRFKKQYSGKPFKGTSEYIESKEYFSWERFFSALLIEKTKSSYLAYSKRNLNQSYLEEKIKAAILMQMDKIRLDWKISDE